MTVRLLALVLSTLAAGGGCCCLPAQCGPCGETCATCCLSIPKPIIWTGACNECGPTPHESCADCCGECGILPFLWRRKTCGKGCGEIYLGEWISDPPDCCDPCDNCGNWIGHQGYCRLGPAQRVLAALHGYRYCPPPNCGPVCGPLCQKPACGSCGTCGPVCGCDRCGGAGCASCGGQLAHGASIHYEGPSIRHGSSHVPDMHPQSILEENWDIPRAAPVSGKPIHKAQQSPRAQRSHFSRPIGTGVRHADYQR